MADYTPPAGPPPPKVPEGWKAQYNEQYSEWFYVNIYTKKSQWEKPTEPVYAPGLSEDERLARQLQAEEEARAGGGASRGAADAYYNPAGAQAGFGQQPGYGAGELPPRPDESARGSKSKGLFSKLMGKGSSNRPDQLQYGQQYGQQQYAQQGYYQQGPPPGQYGGGYGQQSYGYGQQGYAQQQQQSGRRPGMGMAGAAALGLGGGLLGGMLLGEAMDGGDGGDYGGDGGDFGGGDGGGGGDF